MDKTQILILQTVRSDYSMSQKWCGCNGRVQSNETTAPVCSATQSPSSLGTKSEVIHPPLRTSKHLHFSVNAITITTHSILLGVPLGDCYQAYRSCSQLSWTRAAIYASALLVSFSKGRHQPLGGCITFARIPKRGRSLFAPPDSRCQISDESLPGTLTAILLSFRGALSEFPGKV
jgi:hypothetical protein